MAARVTKNRVEVVADIMKNSGLGTMVGPATAAANATNGSEGMDSDKVPASTYQGGEALSGGFVWMFVGGCCVLGSWVRVSGSVSAFAIYFEMRAAEGKYRG